MNDDPLITLAEATLQTLRVSLTETQSKLQAATEELKEARDDLNKARQLTVTENAELEKIQLRRRQTLLRLEGLHKQEKERRAILATLEAAISRLQSDSASNIGSSVDGTDTEMTDQAMDDVVATRSTLQEGRDLPVEDGFSDVNRNPKRDRNPESSTESSPAHGRNVAQKTDQMIMDNEPPVKPKRNRPSRGKAGKIELELRSQLKFRQNQTDDQSTLELNEHALRLVEKAHTTVPADRRNHYIKQQVEHVVECRGLGPLGCDIELYDLFIRGGVFKEGALIITLLSNYIQEWEEFPERVEENGRVALLMPAEGPSFWLCPSDHLCLPRYCLGQDAARPEPKDLPLEEACEDCVKANRICFFRKLPRDNFRVVMLPLSREHRMDRDKDGNVSECGDADRLRYWVKDPIAFIAKYGGSGKKR